MKKSNRFVLAILVIVCLLGGNIGPILPLKANAQSKNSILKQEEVLSQGIPDKETGYIYSSSGSQLYFINEETLGIDKKVDFHSRISDMELSDGKIYVVLEEESRIAVLDAYTKREVDSFTLNIVPTEIAVGKGHIYFVGHSLEGYSTIVTVYEYNIASKKVNKLINKDLYNPAIFADVGGNRLYAAETGVSAPDIYVMDMDTNSIINSVKDSYLFDGAQHNLLVYGENMVLGKYRAKVNDLNHILDTYDQNDKTVLYAGDQYLFTRKSVYNLQQNKRIVALPEEASWAAMNEKEEVYLYYPGSKSLVKYSSVWDIAPNLSKSMKFELDEEGNVVFTWDALPEAEGYNLWYQNGVGDYVYPMTTINSRPLKENKFVITESPKTYSETWTPIGQGNGTLYYGLPGSSNGGLSISYVLYKVSGGYEASAFDNNNVYFGVSPIINGKSCDIVENDMKKLPFDTFKELAKGLKEGKYVHENIADIGKTYTKSEGPNADGTSSAYYYVEKMLFDYLLDNIDNKVNAFEINKSYGTTARNSLFIPTDTFAKIQERNDDSRILFTQSKVKYELPAGFVNLNTLPQGEADLDVAVQILEVYKENELQNIRKSIGSEFEIKNTPFEVKVGYSNKNQSKSFELRGEQSAQLAMSLDGVTDTENIAAIRYNPKDGTYASVPVDFQRDGNGKLWGIIEQTENGIYLLAEKKPPFKDIEAHWARKDIELLAAKNMVYGTGNSMFSPDSLVTRAEYMAMLTRVLGISKKDNATLAFKDVHKENWFYDVIGTAVEFGLAYGYSDHTFKPDEFISREEMTALTVRALKYGKNQSYTVNESLLNRFKDADKIGNWAKEDVSVAVDNQMIKGKSTNVFDPGGRATRAESAAIINRLYQPIQ